MKIKDLILISIIIAVLALATYNITIEQYTEGGILGAIAFYTLMYVIVSIVREKRLESELSALSITHAILKSSNEDRRKRLFSKIRTLETDLANQVKATDIAEKERDEYKRMYPSNLRDEQIISDLIDWQDQTGTFAEDTPYIGQMVKVKYGSTYKVAPITRILDEGAKGLRYRVRGCGSAKYKVSDFRDYDENEIPDYGVKLTKKE